MSHINFMPEFDTLDQVQSEKLKEDITSIKDLLVFDKKTGESISLQEGLAGIGIAMTLADIASKYRHPTHNAVIVGLGLEKFGWNKRG